MIKGLLSSTKMSLDPFPHLPWRSTSQLFLLSARGSQTPALWVASLELLHLLQVGWIDSKHHDAEAIPIQLGDIVGIVPVKHFQHPAGGFLGVLMSLLTGPSTAGWLIVTATKVQWTSNGHICHPYNIKKYDTLDVSLAQWFPLISQDWSHTCQKKYWQTWPQTYCNLALIRALGSAELDFWGTYYGFVILPFVSQNLRLVWGSNCEKVHPTHVVLAMPWQN